MKKWNWKLGFVTTLALFIFYIIFFYLCKEINPERYENEIVPAKIVAFLMMIGGTLYNAWKFRQI